MKIPALQKSTMEVRIPQDTLMRSLSIIAAVPVRRLTQDQRRRMEHLWQLSFREYQRRLQ
jgi:hypothetical protein